MAVGRRLELAERPHERISCSSEHLVLPDHPPVTPGECIRDTVTMVRLVATVVLALTTVLSGQEIEVNFHHLHLAGGLDFYARLFESTERTSVAGFEALRSGRMLLLFGRPMAKEEQPSAIWHFGWGDVKVGDTYLRHAAREVEWEPPLPADKLHLHLQSPSPAAAAAWYRDVLGASVEVLPGTTRGRPVEARPELRMAEAAVWFGDFAMVIHRTDADLVSTRGQRADHIALHCDQLDLIMSKLRDSSVQVVQAVSPFGDGRHAMIEGPDRILIELVEDHGYR
jgi:catechol 2,3-dioxygenase-like lactoylglutathione lyase family enzyme